MRSWARGGGICCRPSPSCQSGRAAQLLWSRSQGVRLWRVPLTDASRSNGAFLGAMPQAAVCPRVVILTGQGCPHLGPETAPWQEGPRSLGRVLESSCLGWDGGQVAACHKFDTCSVRSSLGTSAITAAM